MRRIIKSGLIAGILVSVVALSGCATDSESPAAASSSSTADTAAVDMTNSEAVAALCGTPKDDGSANVALAAFTELVKSDDSGRRNEAFKAWGVNPQDEKAVTDATSALTDRANTPCTDVEAGAETGGAEQPDGTVSHPLLVGDPAGGTVAGVDTTSNPVTPPLLDFHQRFHANALTWGSVVEQVKDKQWYIDAINQRAPYTGFNWDDMLKFAAANYTETAADGSTRVAGANALLIQVYNYTEEELSDAQLRAMVSEYITPEVEAQIGIKVDEMQIQRWGATFNTRNVGTKTAPKVGDYLDYEKMVRVSLTPFIFDENGKVVNLNNSGSGIYMDCLNIHWMPKLVWKCTDSNCNPPPKITCPPGTTGTPPNCLEQKVGPQDPWPRRNAPTGGGPNADPGPGTYRDPSSMEQPGSTPRVNPATPAPTVAPSQPGAPAPTADPAPAPAPEPSAPAPSKPETGCIPVPEVVTCP